MTSSWTVLVLSFYLIIHMKIETSSNISVYKNAKNKMHFKMYTNKKEVAWKMKEQWEVVEQNGKK